MSTRLKLDSKIIRIIWMKRDLFSDNCHSLLIRKLITNEIISLKDSVEHELSVKNSMTQVHLNKMRQVRKDYEELVQKQKEKEELEKKASKGSVKKPNKSKTPKKVIEEPPIVDESTYIDVEDEYVAYEDEKSHLRNLLNSPDLLNIGINEINLREFNMIGGILQVECFERPSQPVEIHEHLFLRLINEQCLQKVDFHQILKLPKLEKITKQKKSILGRSISVKFNDEIKKSFDELIKVEIELRDHIFWWEAPKVCIWEENEKKMENFNSHEKSKSVHKLKLFDFDLENSANEVDRYLLAKNYLIPMMPVEFNFFHEQLEIFLEKQKEWKQILMYKEKFSEIEKHKSQDSLKKFLVKNCKIDWNFEKFNEIFNHRSFQPRDLFPKKHRNLIKVLEVCKADETDLKNTITDEIQPTRQAHMMLSELLDQIGKVHESLQPFFDKIEEKRESLEKISKEILEKSNSVNEI